MRFDDLNTFKREITVESFECDMNNRIKLSAILREMQEIGNIHLEALGYPRDRMNELEWAFLLSKIYIKVYRTPCEGEKLIQQTAPKKTKGIYFFRDINFYDEEGRLLIEAHTAWVLVSTAEGKHSVLRPRVFSMPFECDDDTDYTIVSYKFNGEFPESDILKSKREIRFTDIDCNKHMNNAVYADIVYDAMPIELAKNAQISEFRINFKNEALLSDTLSIIACDDKNTDTFKVYGMREADTVCFEAELKYK